MDFLRRLSEFHDNASDREVMRTIGSELKEAAKRSKKSAAVITETDIGQSGNSHHSTFKSYFGKGLKKMHSLCQDFFLLQTSNEDTSFCSAKRYHF